jgi:hypothetical protein
VSLRRVVILGDNHGDLIHRKDAEVFFEFLKDWRPHGRYHLGDNWDLRNLRRGADPAEEGDDMTPDLNAGFDFLNRYKPNVFCLGNHDWRAWRCLRDSRGLVRKFAADLVSGIDATAKKIGCTILPYHSRRGVFQLGELAILHGYHAGVGAPAQHARIYRSCCIGHLHSTGQVSERGVDGPTCYVVGGLGDHERMDYASQRTATLAWSPSWAYGVENTKTGKVALWLAKKQDGHWLLPSEIKVR